MKNTKTTTKQIADALESRFSIWQRDEIINCGGGHEIDLRCNDLFTEHFGEEDDDFPEFTGRRQVIEIAERIAGPDLDVEVFDSEKCWFTIRVRTNS